MLRRGGSGTLSVACALFGVTLLSSAARANVSYTYDDLGRVTSITYDDGKRVTYTYDPAGNRTQHVVELLANQTPIAVNDLGAVDLSLGSSAVVFPLTNDYDPDGDILVVQSVTTPSKGTAVITGGGLSVTYTYTASPLLVPTTDSFNYTASDGRGGTAVATVQIDISDTGGGPCIPPPGQWECELE